MFKQRPSGNLRVGCLYGKKEKKGKERREGKGKKKKTKKMKTKTHESLIFLFFQEKKVCNFRSGIIIQ